MYPSGDNQDILLVFCSHAYVRLSSYFKTDRKGWPSRETISKIKGAMHNLNQPKYIQDIGRASPSRVTVHNVSL